MHLSNYRCYCGIICRLILVALAATTEFVAMTTTTRLPANRNNYAARRSFRRRSSLRAQPYTESTFPTPGGRLCMSDYAKLWYLCDPHLLLDYTEAINLNKSLNPWKFSRCLPRTPTTTKISKQDSRLYSLGLAIADDVRTADSSTCGGGDQSDSSRDYDGDDPTSTIKTTLHRIAKRLRNRWMYNYPYACGADILLLFVRNVTLCYRGRAATYSSGRWMLAVSFSGKIRNSISEESALGLEKGEFSVPGYDYQTSVDQTLASSLYYSVLRIFSILDAALPSPDERRRDKDHDGGGNHDSNLHKTFPQHTVPAWALIAFALALGLTMVCTFIGHWVNTIGSRKKFYKPDRFPFARSHNDSRRWRAGFAGGMMELHNNSSAGAAGGQPGGHGGRHYSQVGLKPVSRTKSKMFGAMSMSGASGKRSQFNAQYNYQRV